ncbi:hypothetical protein MMC24_004541 [Lignoscripta atroalba]|nr:hypothetical protein [Lignoscripta atroalba]
MAADTREPSSSSSVSPQSPLPPPPTAPSPPPSRPKTYSTFNTPTPPPNANLLPGGSINTAGGHPREATLVEAAKTIRLDELKEVHKRPCVRDALLVGIGGGFGIGGVRGVLGASVWKACNWAAWTFVFGSWGMYEYCQRKREMELKGMKRAMEIVERKKIEKERKAEEVRAARRKAKEEGDKRKDEEEKRREAEEKRRKGSWRFWA